MHCETACLSESTHAHALSDYGSTVGDPISPFNILANPWIGRIIALFALTLLVVVIVRYRMIYTRHCPRSRRLPRPRRSLPRCSSVPFSSPRPGFDGSFNRLAGQLVGISRADARGIRYVYFGLVQEYGETGNVQGVIEGLLLRDTLISIQGGYTEVIIALVEAVEAKDSYTRGHTQRVAELAVAIGRTLRLSSEELRTLNRAHCCTIRQNRCAGCDSPEAGKAHPG